MRMDATAPQVHRHGVGDLGDQRHDLADLQTPVDHRAAGRAAEHSDLRHQGSQSCQSLPSEGRAVGLGQRSPAAQGVRRGQRQLPVVAQLRPARRVFPEITGT